MTRRYWMIIVLCILFNIACGVTTPLALLPLSTPTAQSVNTAVYIYVTSAPTVTHYCFGIVQVERLNLRERPSYYAPADGQGLVKFQIVTLLDTIGDWCYVETSDGRKGYARADYINSCIK